MFPVAFVPVEISQEMTPLSDCQSEFAQIARLFGAGQEVDSEEQLSKKAIDAVNSLFQQIGMPRSLAQLGLPKDQQAAVATQAMQAARLVNSNPAPLDAESMLRIVEAAYAGDRTMLATP